MSGLDYRPGTQNTGTATSTLGSGDDGAALTTLLAANAGKLQVQPLATGAYSATSPIVLPSNVTARFGPGVTYNAAPTSGPSPGAGWTYGFACGLKVTTLATTLSANATVGSATQSVTSTAGLAAGQWVALYRGSGDMAMSYQIASVGSGTVTFDRPVWAPFKSGDDLYFLTPNHGIDLDLGGAIVNVTLGSRSLWIPFGVKCRASNAVFNISSSSFGLDLDIGAVDCALSNIRAVYVANCAAAFAVEWGERVVYDRCQADGAFGVGFRWSGYDCTARNCGAQGYTGTGFMFRESGTLDIGAAIGCTLDGGTFYGGQYGVVWQSNATKNEARGVKTSNCSVAGFYIATGVATSVTVGASYNIVRDCEDNGSAVSFAFGDGSTGAVGNEGVGCTSDGATTTGYVVNGDATLTSLGDCKAINGTSTTGYGFSLSGIVTVRGCTTYNTLGRGFYFVGQVTATNLESIGDGGSGSGRDAWKIDGTGSLTVTGGDVRPASGCNAIYNASTGVQTISEVTITLSGSGVVGVYAVAAGTVKLRDVRVVGASSGNYGLYIVAGSVEIGPGCAFDAMANPVTIAGGTVTIVQAGGVAAVSAAASLTFAQHYCLDIELAAGASADSTITVIPFIGATWVARNLSAHNLIVKTSTAGDSGITVAAGKSATVSVRASDAKMSRVTADT